MQLFADFMTLEVSWNVVSQIRSDAASHPRRTVIKITTAERALEFRLFSEENKKLMHSLWMQIWISDGPFEGGKITGAISAYLSGVY